MSDEPLKPNEDADSMEEQLREATDPLYALQKVVYGLGAQVQAVFDKLASMEARQGNIEQGIVNLGIRMEAVESSVASLRESAATLDAKFDSQLQSRLDSINSELAGFRADTEKGFRSLDRQYG